MAVRIGKIELNGVQELHTEESRTLVEQRVPEQQGSVFQDLGREPVSIILDGLLFSEEALSNLEDLRAAQIKAEPLSFAADIAVGTDLTDIIIEDIKIRQVAGYAHRYRYSMRLREYKKPPEPANAGLQLVNFEISVDAESWSANMLAATSVLQNPASLLDAIQKNPGLLSCLSVDELTGIITQNVGSITGSEFGDILNAVKKIDPAKVLEVIQAVRDAGSLGEFIQKYADEGLDFASNLTGVDLRKAGSLIKALSGGLEFLKALKKIGDNASKLIKDLGEFDPLAPIKPLLEDKE
jgi:hypothetical protein